jgi:hypothetical protein
MRFLSAAMVGLLSTLFAVAAPTITITMDSRQPSEGSIRPTITLSAGTNATLDFRRYSGTSCSGSFQSFGSVTVTTGSTTYTGPNLQTGSLGQFSLWVLLHSGSTTLDTKCFPYVVQRIVTATATLAKTVYDDNDRMEPAVALANTTSDAGGQIEIGRWASAGCGPGNAVSVGILPVVAGKALGTLNMQDGVMGAHSFRVTYSGDTKNSQAVSLCKDYTTGVYIRGRVFEDNDGSGTLDPGEQGVAGATVTVRKGQSSVGSATTTGSGLYEILVTSTGTYTVSLTPPQGFEDTGGTELTVQVTGSTLTERNFGVAHVPSTLLAKPTGVAAGDPADGERPNVQSPSQAGFAVLSFVALGLVAVAAVAMLVLVFTLRGRNEAG